MDWVTDQKAIDTLIALGELRPGDEVRVMNCRRVLIDQHVYDGDVVVITRAGDDVEPEDHPWLDDPKSSDCSRRVPTLFNCERYVYVRENIAAWRRPGVPKEQSVVKPKGES